MCAYVRTRAHARARQSRGNKTQKRSAKNSTPITLLKKYMLNVESVAVFLPYVNPVWRIRAAFFCLVNFSGCNACSGVA